MSKQSKQDLMWVTSGHIHVVKKVIDQDGSCQNISCAHCPLHGMASTSCGSDWESKDSALRFMNSISDTRMLELLL